MALTQDRCIITAASNKFFPSLINLLNSIHRNYPGHPAIYVYDLGLFPTFRIELEHIPWVTVLQIPHFVPYWRSCYTWKTYIFKNPLATNNLYLDAGNQVLRPLDPVFEKIDTQGYLTVGTGGNLKNKDIIPTEYISLFDIPASTLEQEVVTAGILGFKKNNTSIEKVTHQLFQYASIGLCLGFSPTEQWKNRGVNKNPFIRNATYFRHDNTLLCIAIARYIPAAHKEAQRYFDIHKTTYPEQYIWNLRLNYATLDYLFDTTHSKTGRLIQAINKGYLFIFIGLKGINRYIKGIRHE